MQNETQLADHLLSTDQRRHFSDRQFSRFEWYEGPLSHLSEDDAHTVLKELLDYFVVDGFDGMPAPPAGLPGALHRKVSVDDPEYSLVMIGYAYFLAAVRGQSRAMHNRWDDARHFIQKLEEAARQKLLDEILARDAERSLAADRKKEEAKQLVYFIGAASGPIKIGIAVNPESRRRSLQTSHHEPLEILATCDGGQEKERAYHLLFANRRLQGEWFDRCPEILAEIERLA